MTLRATVLIPAHDEATVIARTLAPLGALSQAGVLRIIVIANGCTDATASAAAAACPQALILQTATAGKTQALNLGIAHAAAELPVLCLDADLEIAATGLLALIAAVERGASAAIGQMQIDNAEASAWVRAYQRGWALHPYFARGKFGGVFCLSPQTARQVFPLPKLTGDDEYLRRSLAPADVAFVPECQFVARAPRHLSALFATRKRALRGGRQLARLGLTDPTPARAATLLRAGVSDPRNLPALVVFLAVNVAVRLALAFEQPGTAQPWERDQTTRQAGTGPTGRSS